MYIYIYIERDTHTYMVSVPGSWHTALKISFLEISGLVTCLLYTNQMTSD